MSDARNLLERVMVLIEKDIKHIEKEVERSKLDKDSAQDLARYSTALLHMVKDKDTQKGQAKKTLDKMSDEELLELAANAMQQMKGPDGNEDPTL